MKHRKKESATATALNSRWRCWAVTVALAATALALLWPAFVLDFSISSFLFPSSLFPSSFLPSFIVPIMPSPAAPVKDPFQDRDILPSHVRPANYRLHLTPNFETWKFQGKVDIR
jgi:hypothetical protein